MFDFFCNCMLWTLAIYGLVDIIKTIKSYITRKRFDSNNIFIIIAAKNQEQQIESFFRSIIFKILYGKEDFIKKVIVTDLNSVDNTKIIMKKFSKDHSKIKFVDWEECKTKLDNLDCCNSQSSNTMNFKSL